jgi:hypothetical protein
VRASVRGHPRAACPAIAGQAISSWPVSVSQTATELGWANPTSFTEALTVTLGASGALISEPTIGDP